MGQTWFYRIQPKVEASWMEIEGKRYLLVKVEAKNLGNGSFHFGKRQKRIPGPNGTLICPRDHLGRDTLVNKSTIMIAPGDKAGPLDIPPRIIWSEDFNKCRIVTLFDKHVWIRAGETIQEEHLQIKCFRPLLNKHNPSHRLVIQQTLPLTQQRVAKSKP